MLFPKDQAEHQLLRRTSPRRPFATLLHLRRISTAPTTSLLHARHASTARTLATIVRAASSVAEIASVGLGDELPLWIRSSHTGESTVLSNATAPGQRRPPDPRRRRGPNWCRALTRSRPGSPAFQVAGGSAVIARPSSRGDRAPSRRLLSRSGRPRSGRLLWRRLDRADRRRRTTGSARRESSRLACDRLGAIAVIAGRPHDVDIRAGRTSRVMRGVGGIGPLWSRAEVGPGVRARLAGRARR